MIKNIIKSLLLIVSITSVSHANASMTNMLDSMFATTGTAPQPYSSPTRIGVVGGSFQLRTGAASYQVFNFQRPRLNVGCSGISFTGGAFSFLNMDQLKQMTRQIMTSAGTYFLQMAIQSMCPSCAQTLNNLFSEMQKINAMNINSCRAGQQLFEAFADKGQGFSAMTKSLDEGWKSFTDKVESVAGSVSDLVAAQVKKFKAPGEVSPTVANELPHPNTSWAVLRGRGAVNQVGTFVRAGNDRHLAELMMSIIGTQIVKENTACLPGGVSECERLDKENYDPGLRLIDLTKETRDGDSNGVLYRCDESSVGLPPANGCTTIRRDVLNNQNTIKGYVHRVFYGSANSGDKTPVTGSLLKNLQDGVPLTANQLRLLNAAPQPFVKTFVRLQRDNQAIVEMTDKVMNYVVDSVAFIMGVELHRAFRIVSSGPSGDEKKTELTENQKAAVSGLEKDLDIISDRMLKGREEAILVMARLLDLETRLSSFGVGS